MDTNGDLGRDTETIGVVSGATEHRMMCRLFPRRDSCLFVLIGGLLISPIFRNSSAAVRGIPEGVRVQSFR